MALVSKGLVQKFYGVSPRYSYFDGCSQGGHEALGEIQRYPTDFNGVLAGAPASIMTELNSVLHEYTYAQNYDSTGKTILDEPEADIVLNAALKACYPQVGLMLDYRDCERKFDIDSVGHCGGNGPDTYDGLGAVVAWTEKHISPQSLVATQYAPAAGGGGGGGGGPPAASDLTDAVPTLGAPATTAAVRTLPLFPYPELPAYDGHGNVNDASSYVGQVSNALQAPTPWLGKFDTTTIWCNDQGVNCNETNGLRWPYESGGGGSHHHGWPSHSRRSGNRRA